MILGDGFAALGGMGAMTVVSVATSTPGGSTMRVGSSWVASMRMTTIAIGGGVTRREPVLSLYE